jgi:hypothetical protein
MKKNFFYFLMAFFAVLFVASIMGNQVLANEDPMWHKIGPENGKDRCMEQRMKSNPGGWEPGPCPVDAPAPTATPVVYFPTQAPTQRVEATATPRVPNIVLTGTPEVSPTQMTSTPVIPVTGATATPTCTPQVGVIIPVTGKEECDYCSMQKTQTSSQATMAAAMATIAAKP